MQTWYTIKAEAGKTPTATILDEIGGWGVSAKSFLDDVKALDSTEVDVEINSLGGDLFAGLAMYNGLRNSGKKINVKVLGVAASSASVVAMAGDTIEMPENTFMMVHNPWQFAAGDANVLREQADVLDKVSASMASLYAKRTGKSVEEVTALMNAETWFTAQEAVDAGFATSVSASAPVQASFDVKRVPEKVQAVFASATPPADPVPEPTQEPAPADPAPADPAPAEVLETTNAEQVQAIAAGYEMQSYAAVWALDPKLGSDLGAVKARAKEAREIKALCVLASKGDMADGLIRAGKTLADARVDIFAALAEADVHVDTSRPAKTEQATDAKPTAGVTADIWAKRHQQTGAHK